MIMQSGRFYHCWNKFKRRNAVVFNRCFLNLQRKSQLINQNINSRCMLFATGPLPETDVKKFLNHLTDEHTRGSTKNFKHILEQQQIINLIGERLKIIDNIKALTELNNEDQEIKKLVEEEHLTNKRELKKINEELIQLILDNLEEENYDGIILEMIAGVGGQESMLFLKDLLNMYLKHFSYLEYEFDIISLETTSQKGIRNCSIMISGRGSFSKLRYEAGVHRVQRVPATEKSGRVHTSVVSVAVLPQPNDIQITINPNDLRIDTMRASGAGGQHVNTTNSAVRITHLPTGLVSECQEQRSQIKNRQLAMAKLRARLYEAKLSKQRSVSSSIRKNQMGEGQRNEKIRTYNFMQDRVTDHRLSNGTLHNLHGFLNGGEALDKLHEELKKNNHYKIFLEIVNSL